MSLRLFTLALAIGLTAGCTPTSSAALTDGTDTAFDPMAFFTGHTHSWGVVEDRSGAPTKWVVTDSHGTIEAADRLRMVQHLAFADGTSQERDWVLWRSGPDRYDATANDMVGTARGQVNGRIFHWQWVLAHSPGNPLMNLSMQQWMYHMADGSVTIRTTVSKLGFIVAEVTEQFVRVDHG